MKLPDEITQQASLRGQEWAWPVQAFPVVLKKAASLGLACDGGQFQFRLPQGGTCEMYWHSINPSPRFEEEKWEDFVARRSEEVALAFTRLQQVIDFRKESLRWDLSGEKARDPHFEPVDTACFVAYFIHDPDDRSAYLTS